MIFVELFKNMSIVTVFSIISGLMLIIIHMQAVSSRRMELVIVGTILILGGIALRLIMSFSFPILFALIFFVAFVLLGADILILFLQKRAWMTTSLSHAIMQREKETSEYDFLKDLTALSITEINGTGQISLNDNVYDVHAGDFIEKGSFVKIINCEGNKILVQKIEADFFRNEEE